MARIREEREIRDPAELAQFIADVIQNDTELAQSIQGPPVRLLGVHVVCSEVYFYLFILYS